MDKRAIRRTERYTGIPSDDNNGKQSTQNRLQQKADTQTDADTKFAIRMP